jgi:hypothetical protein
MAAKKVDLMDFETVSQLADELVNALAGVMD